MWLLTNFGFFSIVQKPDDQRAGTLTVRSRVSSDLEALREKYLPNMGGILADAGSDYKYRTKVPRETLAAAMLQIVLDLNYDNFKDSVAKTQEHERAHLYHQVWDVLYHLQEQPAATAPRTVRTPAGKGLAPAYGGVLVDESGRVLLRKPTNAFGNYIWSFPKGRSKGSSTPEQTAVREVLEETGYEAEIIARIPGGFQGDTTVTEFFLMRPLGEPRDLGAETEEVKWVAPGDAPQLLNRDRDHAVLEAALLAYGTWRESQPARGIFSEKPPHWGSRGDPYLWREMERYFADHRVPETEEALIVAIETAFHKLTGFPITHTESIYIERFSHGGMSSGHVEPEFWRDEATPLLRARFAGLRNSG
jgi:8-oxo-dGTP pyrophosphatase MutT (NUDIX family)